MRESICRDCQQPTGKTYAVYCDAHRWRHRLKLGVHKLTPEREAYLRAHYKPLERGMSHRIAKVLSVPKWRVCRWAAELGLTSGVYRFGQPAWTDQDDLFLEQHIGARHMNWISKKLGRSMTACQVRAKRLAISRRDARDWYTARQVSEGFGVDPSTVVRWVERGWLAGTPAFNERVDGRAVMWRITPKAIRRFAEQHRGAYVLGKVSQEWFLDLVFPRQQQRAAA